MDNEKFMSNSVINPCFSLLIDIQESKRIIRSSNEDKAEDISSEYSFHLAPRKISQWIKDDSVNNCYSCNTPFTLFKRKHHCRSCGRIFCFYCCNNFIKLPLDIENFPNKIQENYKDIIKNWIFWNNNDSNRVCNRCHKKYEQGQKIWLYINVFRILDINIKDFVKLSLINRDFNRASNYCISNFRDIQYYLPKQKISQYEKKLLWNNKHLLCGHSKWIVQLIKSLDWNDLEKANTVLQLLTKKKNINCIRMMCSRHCKKNISASDSIELLYINNIALKKFLIHCISLVNDEELLCYLNLIVNNIKYNTNNEIITDFLIQKSLNNINIRFKLYWLLTMKSKDHIFGKHYYNIKNKFLNVIKDKIGEENLEEIINSYKITTLIQQIDFKDNYQQKILNIIKKHQIFKKEITNPFDAFIKIYDIDLDNIIIKESATKPIIIPFKSSYKNVKILLKNEDIRKDQIIIDIIKLMDIILKREENLDLDIRTYNVIPLDNNSGIIEIVQNSKTLYEIKHKMNMTLLNYILENNKDKTIDIVRQKFVKSTAAYCVITYLLGIGDRHLENIMVTNDGALFHIDYGFILGVDPKKSLAPSMRITDEMVQTLGGENSKYYQDFQKLCNRTYNCLRRYYSLFMNMLLLLQDSSPKIMNDSNEFTYDQLKNEIVNRFLPGQVSKEAELHLINEINSSKSGGYGSSLIDTLHYYGKEGISKILWK